MSASDVSTNLPDNAEAVISTVPINLSSMPCAVVNPMLRFEDIRIIDRLLNMIPYGIDAERNLTSPEGVASLRLHRRSIRFGVCCEDWRTAVRKAGELLHREGFCTQEYGDAMVRQIDRYGSYVVLKGGIAIPHASPHDGVLKLGMCLIRLKQPVIFPAREHDPVWTIVGLALTEKVGGPELRALSELLFQQNAERLAAARNYNELISALGDIVSD